MNTSILRSQLWELWRLTRMEIAYRSCGVLFIAALVHGVCVLMGDMPGSGEVYPVLMSMAYLAFFADACTPFFYSPAPTFWQNWRYFLKAQYPRPVGTTQILGVPLAYELVLRIVGTTLLAWTFPLFYGLDFPIASIVVFASVAGVATFCILAGVAGFRDSLAAITILAGAALLVLAPGVSGGASLLDGPAQWHVVFAHSTLDYFVMLVVSGAYAVYAWRAMDRDRHDTNSKTTPPRTALPHAPALVPQTPFPSALRAQLWMEVRRASELWQAIALLVPLAVGLSVIAEWLEQWQFYLLVWIIALITCPATFIFGAASQVSGLTQRAGTMRFSTFEATQAIPVGRSLGLKLAVVFCANIVGTALFLAAACFTWHFFPPASVGLVDRLLDRANRILAEGGPLGVAIAAAVVFGALSIGLTLLSFAGLYGLDRPEYEGFRKPRYARLAEIALPAYGFLAIIDLVGKWDFTPFWIFSAWAASTALVALTLRGLWRLYRSELVARPAFPAAVLLWLAFVIAAAWLLVLNDRAGARWNAFESIHVFVFFVGLSFIPLGGFAWAPLALAARRSQ